MPMPRPVVETNHDTFGCVVMGVSASESMSEEHHQRPLSRLIDRLPGRFQQWTRWLLKPESRWARIPAAILLILGGLLGMLPLLGFWMLPLGFILIAEDLPIVRRGVARVLEGLERRRPQWFSKPRAD